MANISDYAENKILDHMLLESTSFTAPTNVWIALFSSTPTDTGGTELAVANGYARLKVGLGEASTKFDTAAAGVTENVQAWSFTASGANWLAVLGAGIYDAATVGNLLFWGTFSSVQINDGDTLTFPLGQFVVTMA